MAGPRGRKREERRAPIQIIRYLRRRQCVHFAPIRWGMVEIHTVDARIATLIVNVCYVLGTRYPFLSFAPQHFCCPIGRRQGSRVNPSWVVPAFSTTAPPTPPPTTHLCKSHSLSSSISPSCDFRDMSSRVS